jgi:hypothetical protein
MKRKRQVDDACNSLLLKKVLLRVVVLHFELKLL